MIRQKRPQPVAYCWYHGKELSRGDMRARGCTDPNRIAEGTCKHLQRYGPEIRTGGARLTMQELQAQIVQTLKEHGMRLEGSRICLVQELPDGGVLRFWWDEERRARDLPCCKKA